MAQMCGVSKTLRMQKLSISELSDTFLMYTHLLRSRECTVIPQMRHHANMMRFWNRLVNMDDDRLIKKVFMWDWMLNTANWRSEMLTVLKTVSSENVFWQRVQCDIKDIESRLVNNMMLNWEREIQQKPKLRTYIRIKSVFGTEDYLKLPCISKSEKSLLAQLRLGTLPLRIETGRFRWEDIGVRLCVFCTMNVVEHEQHFICECDAYDTQYPLFNMLCQYDQFNFLLVHCWQATAKFIRKAWRTRQAKMYTLSI